VSKACESRPELILHSPIVTTGVTKINSDAPLIQILKAIPPLSRKKRELLMGIPETISNFHHRSSSAQTSVDVVKISFYILNIHNIYKHNFQKKPPFHHLRGFLILTDSVGLQNQ
jgi:hypothetical protein